MFLLVSCCLHLRRSSYLLQSFQTDFSRGEKKKNLPLAQLEILGAFQKCSVNVQIPLPSSLPVVAETTGASSPSSLAVLAAVSHLPLSYREEQWNAGSLGPQRGLSPSSGRTSLRTAHLLLTPHKLLRAPAPVFIFSSPGLSHYTSWLGALGEASKK